MKRTNPRSADASLTQHANREPHKRRLGNLWSSWRGRCCKLVDEGQRCSERSSQIALGTESTVGCVGVTGVKSTIGGEYH